MEGFSDLLEDIKKLGGPLMWITQKKNFIENEHKQKSKRTPDQLKQDVLQSARLRHVIDQIIAKQNSIVTSPESFKKAKQDLELHSTKLKREDVEKEAKKILDEMAHQFDLKYVRTLGYALIKVFSLIYKHIYYNSDIDTNMSVLKHYPTLLLPLHRSYMDFLLVSIICFHKNISLPAVAAGQDFLGLSFMSNVIRHTGAFFIRRSFGSDELYWAIFHEYVQQHLSNCDRPLEFFIEGTRSRTSKSLQPKQGMLSTCVELYMKGHRTQDIYFVPISLTYERLLEEILYSNELLGIPKPKETVGGLVKARSILNQSYGSIFINFSRPISLREVLHNLQGPKLNLRSNLLNPSFIFELSSDQFKAIESMSYLILIDMLRNQVIQPISLISTCLLLSSESKSANFDTQKKIDLQALCYQIDKLKRILINLGVKVYWPLDSAKSHTPDEQFYELNRVKNLILDTIELHLNLFDLNGQTLKSARETNINECNLILSLKQPHLVNRTQSGLFESASLYIALCSYKNQLVNSLIRQGFVCNSLLGSSVQELEGDRVLKDFSEKNSLLIYKFLTCLFNREFIFRQGDEEKDFADSLTYFTHTNLVKQVDDKLELIKFNLKQFLLFSKLFEQILLNYQEIYECILGNSNNLSEKEAYNEILSFKCEKELVKKIQTIIFEKMLDYFKNYSPQVYNFDFEILSLNMITNAVQSLRQFGVASKSEIKLDKLKFLVSKLTYLTRINRIKSNSLIKLSNLFDMTLPQFASEKDFHFVEQSTDRGGEGTAGEMVVEYEKFFVLKNSSLVSKI